jgi:hypothetical protein
MNILRTINISYPSARPWPISVIYTTECQFNFTHRVVQPILKGQADIVEVTAEAEKRDINKVKKRPKVLSGLWDARRGLSMRRRAETQSCSRTGNTSSGCGVCLYHGVTLSIVRLALKVPLALRETSYRHLP